MHPKPYVPIQGSPLQVHPSLEQIYLPVYSLVFLADWLQGSYVYALYTSKGYSLPTIALLFVAGFSASAVSGPFMGMIADRYSTRLACCLFCVVYAMSAVMNLSASFGVLIAGRIASGISTSLLYTCFESWLVSNHLNQGIYASDIGLDPQTLSSTFSKSTFLNGLMAILSGLIANYSVEAYGMNAPFLESALVLGLALSLILALWPDPRSRHTSSTPAIQTTIARIAKDRKVVTIMAVQTVFEGGMYIFVLLWTPLLDVVWTGSELPPYGLIFSAFMVSTMVGSVISRLRLRPQTLLRAALVLAACSFGIVSVSKDFTTTFVAFNVFEVACGVYFPSVSAVKAVAIGDESRTTVMNLIRMPMNVVVAVVFVNLANIPPTSVFCVLAICLCIVQTQI